MDADQARYYSTPGPMTALPRDCAAAAGLPEDPVERCSVVQGLIVHEFWAGLYEVSVAPGRADEVEIRRAAEMTQRMLDLDPSPLSVRRPPARRMFGNCRHFSVFSCALLRAAGIPARARCGFATYFEPGRFVDHWVVEYWDTARGRWRRVDAQLDEAQQHALALQFDPTDVPGDAFVTAGDAWQLCRTGRADPERFGILDFWGLWFVRNNVVRDVAALNNMELLPWDTWGVMELGEPADDLVDEAAAATLSGDWARIESIYGDERLRVPATVTSQRAGTVVAVPR